ncbi:MAG: hypothetical protein PHT02_00845 [Tissierellia bacterium]|nr:hypothetical protein [Tissierellia bacterium]
MYYYIKAEKDNKPFFFCFERCKNKEWAKDKLKYYMNVYYAFYNDIKVDVEILSDREWYKKISSIFKC